MYGNDERVSIIFSARNEAAKVAGAVSSMLAQDYPNFEVLAVDDRSEDGTPQILETFTNPREPLGLNPRGSRGLRLITVRELPQGWLGKTHGLYQGFRESTGEWLVFTDADIIFQPQILSRAVAAAESRKLDHLTLLPRMGVKPFIGRVMIHYFLLIFCRAFRMWAASNPKSKAYIGVGAFNMVRRNIYEKFGTHRALSLEVIDDVELGRKVKLVGGRSQVMQAEEYLHVDWIETIDQVGKIFQKNAFAGAKYQLLLVILGSVNAFLFDLLPFVTPFLVTGVSLQISLATLLIIFLVYLAGNRFRAGFWLTFPFHPVGSVILLTLIWRSALAALREGGVRWRGTFYPLDEIRKYYRKQAP